MAIARSTPAGQCAASCPMCVCFRAVPQDVTGLLRSVREGETSLSNLVTCMKLALRAPRAGRKITTKIKRIQTKGLCAVMPLKPCTGHGLRPRARALGVRVQKGAWMGWVPNVAGVTRDAAARLSPRNLPVCCTPQHSKP